MFFRVYCCLHCCRGKKKKFVDSENCCHKIIFSHIFIFSVVGVYTPLIVENPSLHHGKLWSNYIDKVRVDIIFHVVFFAQCSFFKNHDFN
jgi:hypothetical protein